MTFECGNAADLQAKIEAMYHAAFDHGAIAREAMARYDAEAYYGRIMEAYGA